LAQAILAQAILVHAVFCRAWHSWDLNPNRGDVATTKREVFEQGGTLRWRRHHFPAEINEETNTLVSRARGERQEPRD